MTEKKKQNTILAIIYEAVDENLHVKYIKQIYILCFITFCNRK